MRTPQYALAEDYTLYQWPRDPFVLPKGSAVQPISEQYVPRHIKESTEERHKPYGLDGTYCFTNVGIVWLPGKFIRRLE